MTKGFRFKQADIGRFVKIRPFGVSHGCHIFGLTMGDFSLIDIIYQILSEIGPSRVVVATWSAGIKDVHQVKWMVDYKLITDFKLLTDHSYRSRQSRYAASIEDIFGVENIRTSEMHAKFVLVENAGHKVVVTSSMNLNANKTCELFEIIADDGLYEFMWSFVEAHFKDMKPGFVQSGEDAMKCVSKFFNADHRPKKHWSEL